MLSRALPVLRALQPVRAAVRARVVLRPLTTSTSPSLDKITYSAPKAFIRRPAPSFTADAVGNGEIKKISLEQYRGKWVVLLFYPKDFTFVCPTELIAFSDRAKDFEKLGAQVLGVSVDSPESHLAWINLHRAAGGLGSLNYPLLSDLTKQISADYGCLVPEIGIALRGLYIIDPSGILQQATVNNFPVGRSVDETIRLIQAFQFHAEHGEVCPANWKPGDLTIKPNAEDSLEYFGKAHATPAKANDANSSLKAISSKKELESYLKAHPKVIVKFEAPWCNKCKQIAPFVIELAREIPAVHFVTVDTSASTDLEVLSKSHGVEHLPTFVAFHNGVQQPVSITGYKKQALRGLAEQLAGL